MFSSILCFIFIFSSVAGSKAFLKRLSKEDERKFLEEHKDGSLNARDKLIEHNMRLVAHIAKKYSSSHTDFEDLISIGTIGLIKGVDSFEHAKGFNLSTYIARCIQNEIFMHLRSSKKYQRDLFLQDSIGSDNEGNEITVIDIIEASDEDIFEQVELQINSKLLYERINEVLSERERYIIMSRYGLNNLDIKTQRELSKELKISRSYVSRIQARAIKKLSKVLPQ